MLHIDWIRMHWEGQTCVRLSSSVKLNISWQLIWFHLLLVLHRLLFYSFAVLSRVQRERDREKKESEKEKAAIISPTLLCCQTLTFKVIFSTLALHCVSCRRRRHLVKNMSLRSRRHRRCFSLKRTSEFAQQWFHELSSSSTCSRRHPPSLKRDTSSTIDISQKVVLSS